MAVEQLLQYVHPNAVYRRVPLADDQNALGPWREAIEHYVPPDADDPLWGQLIYGAGETGEPVAFPAGPRATAYAPSWIAIGPRWSFWKPAFTAAGSNSPPFMATMH